MNRVLEREPEISAEPTTRVPQVREANLGIFLTQLALLFASAIFFALRFLHITADFPNGSRWQDWSKYTDEGWYGDAAIRHFLIGHWRVPGDFNPAAALPIWPLMESAVFHFTGVSLIAARVLVLCVFGVSLALTYLLVRRYASPLAAAIAVFLIATSSFSHAFSRLAILEPPLTMLWLLALLTASYATPRRWWTWIAIGVLATAMVLTKTTGATLLPAIAVLFCWRMWPLKKRCHSERSEESQQKRAEPPESKVCSENGGHSYRAEQRPSLPIFFLASLIAAAIAITLYAAYFFKLIKPHYYADFHYLFTDANPTPKISLHNLVFMTREALHAALWIDRILYPTALGVFIVSLVWLRNLWRNPLYVATWTAIAGYMAFVVIHSNMQPRYFHLLLVPIAVILALAFHEMWKREIVSQCQFPGPVWQRRTALLLTTMLAALATATTINITETIRYVTHPEYTFINAAERVASIIRADRNHSNLLLSISGSELTLLTKIPSICDDFGTEDLETKALKYKPGWYAAWNELDEGTMSDITPHFRLREAAHFKAFDDPDRDILILYRMTPRTKRAPRRAHPTSAD